MRLYSWSKANWPVLLLLLLLAAPIAAALTAFSSWGMRLSTVLLAVPASYLVCEAAFRAVYRLYHGKPYKRVRFISPDELYMEPHPYLPYVYKKRKLTAAPMPASYPLHQGKYLFGQYTTNNFRYLNGPGGDRDIEVPKPPGRIRIACLGASTTGNYLRYEGRDYSYPMELEAILQEAFPDLDIEVINCGVGGRTTAEILIDFALNIVDTEPDITVLYHAYNDLRESLTRPFASDYSHSRRNLGEVYHRFRLASRFPNLPLSLYNDWARRITGVHNVRNNLLSALYKGTADLDNDFAGSETYSRNIQHLMHLCKAYGIHMICSTYCFYFYEGIRDDATTRKYAQGVEVENQAMRTLCRKNDIDLVDNAAEYPLEERYFVDSVHYSHEGMRLLAERLAVPIIRRIREQEGR